jgi:nitroreductase/NAD-dependent dihydropyrimidine dehydrogenase PreA subunit
MLDNLKQAYLPRTDFPRREVVKGKCKKCLRCYEVCPTGGFEIDPDGYPRPVGYGGMEQACLNCWNCAAVCPTGAISIEGVYSVLGGPYKNRLLSRMSYPDPLGTPDKSFDEIAGELTEVERVIYKRRSNRLFQKKDVPKALLKRILEAGRFAPSAGNCQPYKFIVITDPAVLSEFERLCMKLLRPMKNLYFDRQGRRRPWKIILFSLASLFMVNKMDPRPFTAMEKAERDGDVLFWKAPALILVCKNPKGISNPDLDSGICAQNMVLTAHSLGLGTCYIGLSVEPMSYPHMARFKKRIGLGRQWVPVTSIAIGYPKGRIDAVVKRDTPPVEWIEAGQ